VVVLYVDVSMYDVDRLGHQPDWDAVREATSAAMCARATYGDPAGFCPSTRHFAALQTGARSAGFTIRGGYHNLIRGDQASINRQVDWLRSELDAAGCQWAMLDVERYDALVKNGLWPRIDDAQRFTDRWRSLDTPSLVAYIPRWVWSDSLGQPDLRPLGIPLVASHYGDNASLPPAELYASRGADAGPGWNAYGNCTPTMWQFGSRCPVPGLSPLTDINAYRGSFAEFSQLLTGGDAVAWRTAYSLSAWHRQLKAAFPRAAPPATNVVEWGTIGDPLHNPSSDHSPHDFPGWGTQIVTAADFPDRPDLGLDARGVLDAIRLSRDPRVKYGISHGQLFSSYPTSTVAPFTWRDYTGSDGHFTHGHLSVVGDVRADGTQPWSIGDDDMTPEQAKQLGDLHAMMVNTRGWISDHIGETRDWRTQSTEKLAKFEADIAELKARPPVTIDPAALSAALGPAVAELLNRPAVVSLQDIVDATVERGQRPENT
jgi:hypothetical protein